MSDVSRYAVRIGRVGGDDENMRTAFVVECDAVDENGDVRDVVRLDAIKNDLLVNHRGVIESHTVVFVEARTAI